MTDVTVARNIVRLCPLISNGISWNEKDKDGKEVRKHALAESGCLQGRCVLYDIVKQRCGLLGNAP